MIYAAKRIAVVCFLALAPLAAAQTIVEIAQDTPELSTLVEALGAADLVDTLSGEGPFTVFAPVDSAFEKLPQGQLDALLENPDALRQILTYHVVPERFETSDITADMTEFETVQGSALPITQIGVGQAAVTAVDIEASNGVVYLIDSVLTPPDFEMTEGSSETGGDTGGSMAGSMTGGESGYMSNATRTVRYAVDPQEDSGVSGSVLIAEYDAQTVVTLSLSGTPDGGTHPAELRMGDCGEEGEVVLPLENVNGDTGLSTTVTDTSFDAITGDDHALNVYLSPDDTESAVACGEVGTGAEELSSMSSISIDDLSVDMSGGDMSSDDMTGGMSSEEQGLLETVFYEIYPNEGYEVGGTVQVVENVETGGARVVVSLQNTSEGDLHPAHFHAGSCGDGGDIIVPLESIDGESGSSVTDTGTSFEEITASDFYINIHLSPDEISTIVACGEVGQGAGDQ